MALLASMLATLLLTGLGLSLMLLGSSTTALMARDRLANGAEWSADAAVRLAVSELRQRPDWAGVRAPGAAADVCAEPGALVDDSLLPPAPWDGSTLDLHALTAQRQASAAAAALSGMTVPVWRLYEYGPISRVVPSEPRRHPFYVVVWAADAGGLLLLHATALGPRETQASVAVSLGRDADGALVRLAVRPAR
jgi:hypothetical protein